MICGRESEFLMRRNRHTAVLLLVLLCLTDVALAQSATTRPARTGARQPREQSEFLRFVPDNAGGGRLQTSVVTYRNADGVTVDLVGAVHIADADYYEQINDLLADYDAVLFEMVRPRDATTRPAQGRGATTAPSAKRPASLQWVGTMQRLMRDHLELEYQMEAIDYDRANFVHADLEAETFLEMQEQRGESFFKLMLQAMMRELGKGPAAGAGASQPNVFELLAALQSPDRARQLKLVLAKQFDQMDRMLSTLEGPKGSVILTERNKVALKVLEDRIRLGDKRLAIFYGAGHFKGMEKILETEMGFTQVGQPRWITAWDLTAASTQPSTRPTTAPARTR